MAKQRKKFGVFLSYRGKEPAQMRFAAEVHECLKQHVPSLEPYFYPDRADAGRFPDELHYMLKHGKALILFTSDSLGSWQRDEIRYFALNRPGAKRLWVKLKPKSPRDADFVAFTSHVQPITPPDGWADDPQFAAYECAKEITRRLGHTWDDRDDDPNPKDYPYEYEKTIIDELLSGDKNAEIRQHLRNGNWPDVSRINRIATIVNPITAKVGGSRDGMSLIVDARSDKFRTAFSFPAAGTRAKLAFPSSEHERTLNVGIVVSGGIAPGINAVIDGIVNRHGLYNQHSTDVRLTVRGYKEGFKGLISHRYLELNPADTAQNRHAGGSILGTSRINSLMNPDREALDRIIDNLLHTEVEILYVIGGDGSMRAAHAIASRAMERQQKRGSDREAPLSVVAIPKTMDNDILWVWQAFGFLSAVEKAREIIYSLKTEVESNPRVCIVQLFGSDSGFVVAHAALASGCCDYALIPEVDFSLDDLSDRVCSVLAARKGKDSNSGLPYFVIVMAETAIPTDVAKYIDNVELTPKEREAIKQFARIGEYRDDPGQKRRVRGQTRDELRTGGLKLVKQVLEEKISKIQGFGPYFKDFRVTTNEPRHILRAISPSVSDIIFAERLGALAVDGAMAGYTDFMISQWLTEYVLVPLKLVVLGRKRVPRAGVFWKSVLARTRQEEPLTE